jgi:hypothetical protein
MCLRIAAVCGLHASAAYPVTRLGRELGLCDFVSASAVVVCQPGAVQLLDVPLLSCTAADDMVADTNEPASNACCAVLQASPLALLA